MTSAVELLQKLVRIPSVNPEGDPGTESTGEAACAEFLAEYLKDAGATVELREVLPGRPNVVARFSPEDTGKPRILFAPHTDTVSVSGMTIDPFSGESRDGCIWGRGASDTKGPMAAMLWALRSMGGSLAELSHEIWFAGLVGEEAGQHGSRTLATQEKFDFVLVGEPTGMKVVHTHKGSAWLTLRTRGHAVHSSQPDKGENAIYKMSDAVACLRELATQLKSLQDPVLGHPTLNVGTIRGGSKVNIVPDFCEAAVDIRTIPGQDILHVLAALRQRVPDIEIDAVTALPLNTNPNHPLIQTLLACGSETAGAGWFCDAAVFASAGMPAIAIGPGSIAQAHTADEYMEISALNAGVDFFTNFLNRLK